MEAITWLTYKTIQFWLWLYPFVLYVALKSNFNKPKGEDNANRELAMYLVMYEYEKTEAINLMLQQLGREPISHIPVARSFKSAGWQVVKAQCSNNIRTALASFAWLGLVKKEEPDGKL